MPPVARVTAVLLAALAAASLVFAAGDRSRAADPLAEAIERGGADVRANHDSSDTWQQVRDASGPMYARAAQALRDGRRMLALQRLAAARLNVAAYAFVSAQPQRALTDTTGLAAWWVREGDSLATFLGRSPRRGRREAAGDPVAALATLHPAAIRAVAETALPQVRNYYDAALSYGYATQPEYGIFYVGIARAQRDLYALARNLGEPEAKPEPAFRSIAVELDSLHGRVLAAYRPPLSIDRHPEFIGVSSVIKEARELDAAGLHRGALLRYLTAAQRFAAFHPAQPMPDSAALAQRLAALEARLAAAREDHSIAAALLESAHSEIESTKFGEVSPVAAGIVDEVMPLYFAAIAPAPPAAAAAKKPEVTVTLVRWPYT